MFDKLIDFIISIIDNINPVFIIREFQEAVFLRNGRFKKVLVKGMHFKWPFIDEYIQQHVIWTTLTLPSQSLVTADGHDIVIKSMVKYRVKDVKVFILEVFDSTDAISDLSQGIIKSVIMGSTWEMCGNNDLDAFITKKIKAEMKRWGVEVGQVTLTDIAKIRTIRLINEGSNLG